ncbi:MAG TPA: HEAT repeat domain-containing protein [Methylomirabilota bacterium]|nr:HEAT repeat domain-containing protein [Methylomirabilota bacterium]
MDLLFTVIQVSLAMAALSFLAAFCLVVERWHRNRIRERERARIDQLIVLGLEYAEMPEHHSALLQQIGKRDRRLLLQAFAETIPKIRGELADQMVELMRSLGVVEAGLQQLKSWRWWRRMEACEKLQWHPQERVIQALHDALDDSVFPVRVEAARALAAMGAAPEIPVLLAKLASAGHRSLRVAELFRTLGDTHTEQMISALLSNTNDAARLILIDALSQSTTPEVIDAFRQIFGTASADVKSAVLRAIASTQDPAAWPMVEAGLQDSSPLVRAQAATTAGSFADTRAIPLLKQLLHDFEWWVRYSAGESLTRLKGPGLLALWDAAAGEGLAAEIAGGLLREKGLA